jgi:hypothetical protein
MKKANEDLVQKNIELSTEFSRYLFEHPEIESMLPRDAEIVLLPGFDTKLRAHNRKLGRAMEAHGEKVVYIRVGRLRPKKISRIESVAVGI